jgi:hypothetical protein
MSTFVEIAGFPAVLLSSSTVSVLFDTEESQCTFCFAFVLEASHLSYVACSALETVPSEDAMCEDIADDSAPPPTAPPQNQNPARDLRPTSDRLPRKTDTVSLHNRGHAVTTCTSVGRKERKPRERWLAEEDKLLLKLTKNPANLGPNGRINWLKIQAEWKEEVEDVLSDSGVKRSFTNAQLQSREQYLQIRHKATEREPVTDKEIKERTESNTKTDSKPDPNGDTVAAPAVGDAVAALHVPKTPPRPPAPDPKTAPRRSREDEAPEVNAELNLVNKKSRKEAVKVQNHWSEVIHPVLAGTRVVVRGELHVLQGSPRKVDGQYWYDIDDDVSVPESDILPVVKSGSKSGSKSVLLTFMLDASRSKHMVNVDVLLALLKCFLSSASIAHSILGVHEDIKPINHGVFLKPLLSMGHYVLLVITQDKPTRTCEVWDSYEKYYPQKRDESIALLIASCGVGFEIVHHKTLQQDPSSNDCAFFCVANAVRRLGAKDVQPDRSHMISVLVAHLFPNFAFL